MTQPQPSERLSDGCLADMIREASRLTSEDSWADDVRAALRELSHLREENSRLLAEMKQLKQLADKYSRLPKHRYND